MQVVVNMVFDIDDNSFDDIRRIETHCDELLDLQAWPEIKRVSNVRVHKGSLTRDDVLRMFQEYVGNDYFATTDSFYVRDALHSAGVSEDDFCSLGFDWISDVIKEEDFGD